MTNALIPAIATALGGPLIVADTPAAAGGLPWLWIIIGLAVVIIAVVVIIMFRAGGELGQPIRLVVTKGTHTGTEFALASAFSTIGSEKDNDVVVRDDKVSRHHARIKYAKGVMTISDDNSLYGTFVNGNRVDECACDDGAVIGIGPNFECRVVLPKS